MSNLACFFAGQIVTLLTIGLGGLLTVAAARFVQRRRP